MAPNAKSHGSTVRLVFQPLRIHKRSLAEGSILNTSRQILLLRGEAAHQDVIGQSSEGPGLSSVFVIVENLRYDVGPKSSPDLW